MTAERRSGVDRFRRAGGGHVTFAVVTTTILFTFINIYDTTFHTYVCVHTCAPNDYAHRSSIVLNGARVPE